MADIIPAVLPHTLRELQEALARLRGVAPLVQIDVIDERLFEGQEALPLWEEFDFECDIMVEHPARIMAQLLALGFSRIIVHARAEGARDALLMLQETRMGDYAVSVGLALRAHDTLDALEPFAGLYDFDQVMGIEHEGRQGEPPDPHHREVALVQALRARYPDLFVQVDGASAAHPRELVEAGASRLIVGSAIVHAEDPKRTLKALYTEANAQ